MALSPGLASVVPLTAGGQEAGFVGGAHMFAPFGFLLVLLLLGTVGYFVVKSTHGRNAPSEARTDRALETLRRRYANGDIDEEEFNKRRERLRR